MNKPLFGLLGFSAITSSALLTDGKENLAYGIANISTLYSYHSLGCANDTATVASENNSGLYGSNSTYASTNGSYQADNTAVWKQKFDYNSLSGHRFGEAVIAKNASEFADNCIARIVFNSIDLNASDTITISIGVNFP